MPFVTLEGIDSSGKTTQIDLLKEHFKNNKNIIFTSNPGETQLGKELRKILLHKTDLRLSETNEMLLFFTGIQDNYEKIISTACSQDKLVLCDRYYDSTIAYQGFGRKLNIKKMLDLIDICNLPEPNVTFLFKIDIDTFEQRSKKRGVKDKIEDSKVDFYKNVILGYDELAKIHKDRYIILDGLEPMEVLHNKIKEILKEKLNIC